jgi:hypothetical protein
MNGNQDSLQVQQEVHEGQPSGVSCGEQQLATDASGGHILLEEANNTLKMSSKGNVTVTVHTTDSRDQCKLINLSMNRVERIITEGVCQHDHYCNQVYCLMNLA